MILAIIRKMPLNGVVGYFFGMLHINLQIIHRQRSDHMDYWLPHEPLDPQTLHELQLGDEERKILFRDSNLET